MGKAFVLINTEVDSEQKTLKDLRRLPYVRNAYMVYGKFNIMAEIDVGTPKQLKDYVSDGIRKCRGVRDTNTMIVIE